MKLGLIQFAPVLGEVDKTIEKLELQFNNIKQADLIVLPELANSGYNFSSPEQAFELSESLNNSKFLDFIIEKSKKLNSLVVTGFNERDGSRIYSSAVMVDPTGVIGNYRKIHLFWNEKDYFSKGDLGLPVFETPVGKVGLLVCFDWIFPEVWRILALKGADIICHPSNLVLHYAQKVVPSHAIINRIFAITVNRVGKEKDLQFTGKSIVADPGGNVLFMASENNEEVFVMEIDITRAKNKKVTPRNDVFKDRLPDDYQEIIQPV
jgi:predicted amidohydrolase